MLWLINYFKFGWFRHNLKLTKQASSLNFWTRLMNLNVKRIGVSVSWTKRKLQLNCYNLAIWIHNSITTQINKQREILSWTALSFITSEIGFGVKRYKSKSMNYKHNFIWIRKKNWILFSFFLLSKENMKKLEWKINLSKLDNNILLIYYLQFNLNDLLFIILFIMKQNVKTNNITGSSGSTLNRTKKIRVRSSKN